jgi:hypothetical protein
LRHKSNEQYNPFDDFLFWLQLASMDFTFGFDGTMNTELDIPIPENKPAKTEHIIPKPASQRN